MKFEYSLYSASIPPYQNPNSKVFYKIISYDNSDNFNTSEVKSYDIAFEYEKGAGIVPLVVIGGIILGLIGVAVYNMGLHRQKYDKID